MRPTTGVLSVLYSDERGSCPIHGRLQATAKPHAHRSARRARTAAGRSGGHAGRVPCGDTLPGHPGLYGQRSLGLCIVEVLRARDLNPARQANCDRPAEGGRRLYHAQLYDKPFKSLLKVFVLDINTVPMEAHMEAQLVTLFVTDPEMVLERVYRIHADRF